MVRIHRGCCLSCSANEEGYILLLVSNLSLCNGSFGSVLHLVLIELLCVWCAAPPSNVWCSATKLWYCLALMGHSQRIPSLASLVMFTILMFGPYNLHEICTTV